MSRYYDPVTHRFLNADGYFQSGDNILDTNMNAYCRNNPLNRFWFKCWGNFDKLWFVTVGKFLLKLSQTLYSKIKIWSTFFKGCGCGQSPQYFKLLQGFDSQTACCLAA